MNPMNNGSKSESLHFFTDSDRPACGVDARALDWDATWDPLQVDCYRCRATWVYRHALRPLMEASRARLDAALAAVKVERDLLRRFGVGLDASYMRRDYDGGVMGPNVDAYEMAVKAVGRG